MSFKQGKGKFPITVLPAHQAVQASQGQVLLDVLLGAGVDISHSCGGMGSCGTCRVFVEQDPQNLTEPTEIEREMAEDRGFLGSERLSCQAEVRGPCILRIPGV